MSDYLNINRKGDIRNWICDICGKTFSNGDGSVEAGFGFCNSCIVEEFKSKSKTIKINLNDFKSGDLSDI